MKNIILSFALGAALIGCATTDEVCTVVNEPSEVTQIAPGSSEDFKQNIGDKVYFYFNEYAVNSECANMLNKQATWLKTYSGTKITLEGNCDNRGTAEYNLGLGNRRATSVKNYLVKQGISSDRITAISYGKEKATAGADANIAAKDRNVTVVIG